MGAVASTVLTGWSELIGDDVGLQARHSTRSETAWSLLWPTTSGTVVFGGPVETMIVTKLPFSIRSPGCGSCSETMPTFDVRVRLALDELLEAGLADVRDGELLRRGP